MDFHFPIADVFFNPFLVAVVGLFVGFFAGIFGLGTGILITPVLLLLGFPSRIAVASQLNASIGANLSGFLVYSRKKDVDYALGMYLIIGGLFGALTEFLVLHWLYYNVSPTGILRVISAIVLIVLSIGMFIQTVKFLLSDEEALRTVTMKKWMIYIPFHRVFVRSRTEISILVPLVVGYLTGVLTISLGGGVNVMTVPFLTYLIGRVSPCVTGTSFFVSTVIFFVATAVHALGTAPVDIVLVVFLTVSCSIGSKIGARAAYHLSKTAVSFLGAIMIMILGIKTLLDVINAQNKRPKVILHNGVRHYLHDLTLSITEKTSYLSKLVLSFAHYDPVVYTFFSITLSIFLAYACDKAMDRIFYRHKK